MASITGRSLPGLLVVAASAKSNDGSSEGRLEIESAPFVFAPAIEVNGFAGAATTGPHRVGFALADPSGPVGGFAYDEPLGFSVATATDDTLADQPLRRHHAIGASGAGSGSRHRWIVDHEFDASGPRSTTFALWSHVGPERPGYFAGRPMYWGAYVYGVPTAAAADLGGTSRRYRDLAGEHFLFPDLVVNGFSYGSVEALYDPASRTLAVTITMRQRSTVAVRADGTVSSSTGPLDPSAPSVFTDPLACQAAVDPATSTFACDLPQVNGQIRGRFYGAQAEEIAAVYHRWVPSGSNSNWGPLGAFAARIKP